jgi:predicted phage terminase large subunit-like protein
LPTVELAPFLDPSFEAPRHLRQYGDVLDAAMVDEDRASAKTYTVITLAAPPQHGKTTTTICGLLKAIQTCHGLTHAYATYSQDVTDRIEREARQIAEAAGIVIKGTRTDWFIPATRSRVRWTSIGGGLTSYPVSGLLIVDDPFKDFEAARSPTKRDTAWRWLIGVALRRLHPGAWLIEMATRWHEDDLTARMCDRLGCEYLNIQAICDDENDGTGRMLGEVLWPEKRPEEFIEAQKQADPIPFEAQYQGRPRAEGDALFQRANFYTELPDSRVGFCEAYGTDLSYSKTTTSDWSTLYRGRRYGDTIYVTHGIRKRCDAPVFLEDIAAEQKWNPGPVRFYFGGGGEKGVTQFFQQDLNELRAIPASSDKVVRSTRFRKTWNKCKFLLPDKTSPYYGPWVDEVIQETKVFCGVGDAHDDIVDGLTALHDELEDGTMVVPPMRSGGEERRRSRAIGGF